ncbi:hypothetical protein [Legionella spiritensis]|uniref:hypothetical protein n=1 Tax=Legionella spiritensis TaxID=452 RepID=UPI000F6DD787|nr:hypothetical protein [Legionella spiritensis]VEG90302.1 Uncharacterised protein [Legionella spiritensis]
MLSLNYLSHPHNIVPIWLLYSLFCIPLVYIMTALLPHRLKAKPFLPFIFLYVLTISMLFLGVLFVFLLVLVFHYQKPLKSNIRPWITVDYPDYQRSPQSERIVYGEGSGFKLIKEHVLPKSVRQKVLVAINQFDSKNVNKINSLALSDDLDEIRLYAHSLIEKQERKLLSLIKSYTLELEKTDDSLIQAQLKKQIAEALWEGVYKYLVINENLAMTLDKIKLYATEALEMLPDDMELPLLLTKIALQKSDSREAKSWLKLAIINEAPDYKILAYQAEILYLERNYSNIKPILCACRNKGIFGLQPIISFWTTS